MFRQGFNSHGMPGVLRGARRVMDFLTWSDKFLPEETPEGPGELYTGRLIEMPERDLKRVALISPEPTIDYVKDGRMAEKFVYLLCANTNCITRTVNEDVPPRFYNDAGTIRCRYCRRPYTVAHRKVTDPEKLAYVRQLPARIEPVAYPD
jgi:hypothetical protein